MQTVLIATRNGHKTAEIQSILGEEWCCLSLKDFPGAPAVVEDAATFAGNATKKAVELARWLAERGAKVGPQPRVSHVLADDSGLEVDYLRGAPGVHSARFAADSPRHQGNTPDAENNAKLLRVLAEVPLERRGARFRCVLAFTSVPEDAGRNASPTCWLDEAEAGVRLFEGVCEGHITFAARGEGGFGYDPLFVPKGFELTFAELGAETKNRISHRSRALQAMRRALFGVGGAVGGRP